MKLNTFERFVLLSLAITLPTGTKVCQELARKLFSFAKKGEINDDQENIFSIIEE